MPVARACELCVAHQRSGWKDRKSNDQAATTWGNEMTCSRAAAAASLSHRPAPRSRRPACLPRPALAGSRLHQAKAELVPFLNAERASERAERGHPSPTPPRPAPRPARQADVLFFDLSTRALYESIVDLGTGAESTTMVEGHHAPHSREEIIAARAALLKDPVYLSTISRLNLPPVDVVAAPWPVGADNRDPQPRRIAFILYARNPATNHPDSNEYAFPLAPVMFWDIWEAKVERVEWCYTGDEGDGLTHTYTAEEGGRKALDGFVASEYLPELNGIPPRPDLKPLHITQPEGVSFQTDGNKVEWQKWRFRLGFNAREGPVIHDVTYDGRRVFYRLSLSEMHVPYGDPRPPLHLKQVFDFGDVGLGRAANSLENGCDCLGAMKYFSWSDVNSNGEAVENKNVVCCHEVDNGILWKHTNTPTGRATVTRQRLLVLQTIITVGNYDYIFVSPLGVWAVWAHTRRGSSTRRAGSISRPAPRGSCRRPRSMSARRRRMARSWRQVCSARRTSTSSPSASVSRGWAARVATPRTHKAPALASFTRGQISSRRPRSARPAPQSSLRGSAASLADTRPLHRRRHQHHHHRRRGARLPRPVQPSRHRLPGALTPHLRLLLGRRGPR